MKLLAFVFILVLAACDYRANGEPASPNAQTTAPPPATTNPRPAPAPVVGAPPTFADIVEQARPGVVNIFTRTRVRTNRFYMTKNFELIPEERVSESLGSGFVIDGEGHILTNFHVIKGATDIVVRLFDERSFAADVIGDDPKMDIALLKMREPPGDLPVVELGDSHVLRVGDWVVAIGNPLGLTSTVTAGIVSATGRKSLPLGAMRYQDFIQTDASINPGNSGGALLNTSGEVVGINTAINEGGQGIGFAIPIHMVEEILDRLKAGGRLQRSWLGVYADPIPRALRAQLDLPEQGGALVTRIVRGGPAAQAGLQPGDVILGLDDTEVAGPDELGWLASNIGVGKTVKLSVQRGSETLSVDLVLGALPD